MFMRWSSITVFSKVMTVVAITIFMFIDNLRFFAHEEHAQVFTLLH